MQAKQKGDSQTPRTAPLTGATYRMPSYVKTLLSTITDPHQRGHYKRMFIDAHVTALKHAAEASKKKEKSSVVFGQ